MPGKVQVQLSIICKQLTLIVQLIVRWRGLSAWHYFFLTFALPTRLMSSEQAPVTTGSPTNKAPLHQFGLRQPRISAPHSESPSSKYNGAFLVAVGSVVETNSPIVPGSLRAFAAGNAVTVCPECSVRVVRLARGGPNRFTFACSVNHKKGRQEFKPNSTSRHVRVQLYEVFSRSSIMRWRRNGSKEGKTRPSHRAALPQRDASPERRFQPSEGLQDMWADEDLTSVQEHEVELPHVEVMSVDVLDRDTELPDELQSSSYDGSMESLRFSSQHVPEVISFACSECFE